jgi:hypothetical protein
MQHDARPLFCIAAIALLSGCVTRTVEIRPVAPVVESHSAPVMARPAALQRSQQLNSDSRAARQKTSGGSAEPANLPGVQVEAVIPGIYSGRALSFEKMEDPVPVGPAEP